MTQSLLSQLSASPEQVVKLDSSARSRLILFLLRWQGDAEALACLDLLDVGQMVSLQDMRARALEELGRSNEAVALMEKRLQQKDSATARAQLGRHLLAAGDHERALRIASELTAVPDGAMMSWSFLGDVHLERGDLNAAEAAYLRHQQLAPNSRQPQIGLMRIHQRRSDPVRATAYAVRAFTVLEGEYELPIYALRELRDFFAQSGDENHLRAAEEQLGQRFALEMSEIQALLESGPSERPVRPAAKTVTRSTPDAPSRPQSAPAVTDLATIPVSEEERNSLTVAVKRYFGFAALRPAQAEIMACARRGENVLAILPTGAGKSLCYQLPAILDTGVTLVISPLIALMKDQVDNLPAAIRQQAVHINSSLSGSALQQAIHSIAAGHYKLVYAAPERLRQRSFLYALRQVGLARLVIDEAHCVSVWGHDFRPDYLRLAQAHRDLGSPPLLALTATAPPRVRQDIERQLFGVSDGKTSERLRVIATDIYRPNLHLNIVKARNEDDKLQQILHFAHGLSGNGIGIVYARTRSSCEELSALLRKHGVQAEAYHAGVANRSEMQDRFMRGDIRVMVATVAFGMGVDKSDIRFIIHYGLPDSVEAYYQEVGRAGRDGQVSHCVTLYSNSDKGTLTRHANEGLLTKEYLREVFGAVRTRMQGRTTGLIAFDDLQRDLRSDEDTALRVALSVLEQVGLLTRHDDAPRTLSIQWLAQTELFLPDSAPTSSLFEQFTSAARLRPQQVITRPFMEFASSGQMPMERLEAQLLEWQREGRLRLQASDRDLLITLHPAPADVKQRIDSLLDQFATIQRQRVAEIVEFAADQHCRHGYLANYLGGLPRQDCGACENCGVTVPIQESALLISEEEQQKLLLKTLAGQSWGKVNLIALLRGDAEVGDRGKKADTFGALSFRSESALGKLIDGLSSAGAIRSVAMSHGGVALELTNEGRDMLAGRKYLPESIKPAPLSSAKPEPAKPQAKEESSPFDGPYTPFQGQNSECLEQLRRWRNELATEKQVPAYLIIPNATLQEIANRQPTTIEQLATIKGIGPAKLEQFGATILEVMRIPVPID